MKKNNDTLEALLAGGLLGAAVGAILSKGKTAETALGAITGAAIVATYKANQDAMLTNVPVCEEENGDLYEFYANGDKNFIKHLEKSTRQIPSNFKLK